VVFWKPLSHCLSSLPCLISSIAGNWRNTGEIASSSLGLRVEELDADGVKLALSYGQRAPKLSLPDAFALALAKSAGFVLLTGDALLRDLATGEKVECHGVLWVLDQMFSEGVVQPEDLHAGLSAIARHPRCRLPKDEIASRLARFERHRK